MADKKDDKKSAPKPATTWHPIEIFVILVIFAAMANAFISGVENYIARGDISFYGIHLNGIISFFTDNSFLFKFLSFGFSIGIAGFIIHLSNLRGSIILAEKAKLFPAGEPEAGGEAAAVEEINPTKEKWQEILRNVNSEIAANWRLAVIESDIILDELLDKMNLPGETIGDKLKGVEKSDFTTIELAWEAHKVRNMIAHQSGFQLNQREARLVVSLYEQVFKEFYLI